MQNFQYLAPTSVDAAVGALSEKWGETEVLFGGTDLLALLKERIATPSLVVSLKNVSGLAEVSETDGGWKIGAMVPLSKLLANETVGKTYPAIASAIEGINSPQQRAMLTLGGDLTQRPRCWYFRNGFGLLAKGPDGSALVPKGENQYHAILGNKGPAYFVSASLLAPALIALDAKALVAGPDGERETPLADLFQIPSNDAERELTLAPNELLTAVVIPADEAWKNGAYELRQRTLFDWPLTAASAALKMDGGKVSDARVVMGHVAPKPWRSSEAENALKGKSVSESVAEEAAKAAVSMATPLSKNKHKVQLAKVAVKRAILRAAGKEVA